MIRGMEMGGGLDRSTLDIPSRQAAGGVHRGKRWPSDHTTFACMGLLKERATGKKGEEGLEEGKEGDLHTGYTPCETFGCPCPP